MLAIFPFIRTVLATGGDYARWGRAQKLRHVTRVVEMVASIDRFSLETKIGKKDCEWRDILEWWLSLREARVRPDAKDRAAWFSHANKNFGYKFAWGLGSVIGLIVDELVERRGFGERWRLGTPVGCPSPSDRSTDVSRAFTIRSTGLPSENFFEPAAGAVGRTSAANPFKYVLRCCGPQQVAQIDLRSSVERTGERNASTRIHLGVSA